MGHQSLAVPRNPERSVLQLAVVLRKELRSVMTRNKLLSKMLLRSSVLLSLNVHASMLPSSYPNFLLQKNVLMFLRRCAPDQEPTQGRSRSLLSRNGVMFHQRNLDLLRHNLNPHL